MGTLQTAIPRPSAGPALSWQGHHLENPNADNDSRRRFVATAGRALPDPDDARTTYLTVIDTTTGSPLGEPITLDGEATGPLQFTDNGTRALLTTHESDPDSQLPLATHLAVIDASTGALIGEPFALEGRVTAPLVFTHNGTWVWITTTNANGQSILTVIDTGARSSASMEL